MSQIEKLTEESAKAYAAFVDYCDMGHARSLRSLADVYIKQAASNGQAGKPPTDKVSTLFTWSTRHAWGERAEKYDLVLQEQEQKERHAIRAARKADLENMDWNQSMLLREAVAALLAEVPKFLRRTTNRVEQGGKEIEVITVALATGPGELARAMKLASELQRLSVGEPTEIHKLVESELRATLDLLETNLSQEEFARVVAIIAGS